MPRPQHTLFLAAALSAAAVPAQQFQKQVAPLGISSVPHAFLSNGSGLCVADFDGDGDIDVLVPATQGGPFMLFRNDGGMQFTDVTAGAGLGLSSQARCASSGR